MCVCVDLVSHWQRTKGYSHIIFTRNTRFTQAQVRLSEFPDGPGEKPHVPSKRVSVLATSVVATE